jgi:hypothetical protein
VILLKNVSFERQAQFLYDNICAYPDHPAFTEALGKQATDVTGGLKAHQDLLRRMYSEADFIEGADDRNRYRELMNTVVFLYACFAGGTLHVENDACSMRIEKSVLKQAYRKGSVAKRIGHLERHGFSIRYLSAQGECTSLSKAFQLSMSYDRDPDLLPATKLFVAGIESIAQDLRGCIYDAMGTFVKGDYETAILQQPMSRDALDPLRGDILRTTGDYERQWRELAGRLLGQGTLNCSGFLHYHSPPSWGVSFAEPRKRPLLIFTIGSSILFVEFTLPVASAETIIRARRGYSDAIRERIDSFHCVKCPKKCKGSNMVQVDGVSLCTGRAEARRIYVTLTSPEDFASIHSMLDVIYE